MTHYAQQSLTDRLFHAIAAVSKAAANNFILGVHSDGYWSMCSDEKARICSYLRSLLPCEDTSSRLTLYSGIDDNSFLNEVMSDVFPVIRTVLETRSGP